MDFPGRALALGDHSLLELGRHDVVSDLNSPVGEPDMDVMRTHAEVGGVEVEGPARATVDVRPVRGLPVSPATGAAGPGDTAKPTTVASDVVVSIRARA